MRKTALIVALLLASSGCGVRLSWSKDVTGLFANETEAWGFDPPTYAQTVTVSVNPTTGG